MIDKLQCIVHCSACGKDKAIGILLKEVYSRKCAICVICDICPSYKMGT